VYQKRWERGRIGRVAHQDGVRVLGEAGGSPQAGNFGGKDADEGLDSLQIWAFQQAWLEEDGEAMNTGWL
jgi:hypothetical protein